MFGKLLVVEDKNKDKVVTPDSDFGLSIGFTKNNFEGYLWKGEDSITISLIVSLFPGQGHVQGLINRILEAGYIVNVPTPSGKMERLLEFMGFVRNIVNHELMGPVEVWKKNPSNTVTKIL